MKATQGRVLKNFLLLFSSLLLTSMTLVMGTAPIRILRIRLGSASFWIMGLVVSAALLLLNLKFLGFSFLGMTILVGLYTDLEDKNFGFQKAAVLALATTVGYIGLTVSVWASFQKTGWILVIKEKILAVLVQSNLFKEVDSTKLATEVYTQLPSAAVMAVILGLVLSLVLEKPLLKLFKISVKNKTDLLSFTVPEVLIWVLIPSILGSFYFLEASQGGMLRASSVNVLNIMVMLYFLQGLAIISRFFVAFKVGPFWRAIWTFILITQLFIFVSVLGCMDYWFDFRTKISKRVNLLDKNSKNI